MRRNKSETRPAFDLKLGSRRLVQLRLSLADLIEAHRRVARLEENLSVLKLLAGDDMLQIQARQRGHEHAACPCRMVQAPHAVIAGAMLALS